MGSPGGIPEELRGAVLTLEHLAASIGVGEAKGLTGHAKSDPSVQTQEAPNTVVLLPVVSATCG